MLCFSSWVACACVLGDASFCLRLGTNLPAQIDLYATKGNEYKFLFIAKGGGSANKTFLFQQTKAILNPDSLMKFLDKNLKSLGTSACPPYHLAIVVRVTCVNVCVGVCFVCVCILCGGGGYV
jgi:tartrate dehydratase alpha subunit/fumarate hydratase class I-like protein